MENIENVGRMVQVPCEEVTEQELQHAKSNDLRCLGLTWEQLEAKNRAGDASPKERMTYLAYKDV